jgi:AcrR family transcriptional regulator
MTATADNQTATTLSSTAVHDADVGTMRPVTPQPARAPRKRSATPAAQHKEERRTDATNSETRLTIIDGAKQCFADRGYNGTTTKMIAAAAGVAPGLIYYYFDSKEQLFIAVFEHMYQSRDTRLVDHRFNEHTLQENLATMLQDSMNLAHEDPSFVEVFTLSGREVNHNPGLERAWKEHWNNIVHVWFRIVEAAAERGEVEPEHKQGLVDMLVAWFGGFLTWAAHEPDPERAQKAADEFLRMADAYVTQNAAKPARRRTRT